jgi:hypothetical protein
VHITGERRQAIPFNESEGISRYLVRGLVSIDEKRRFHLGEKYSRSFDDLKSALLNKSMQGQKLACSMGLMSAFLALVLRHVREWVLKKQSDVLLGHYIEWDLNLGMPTDSYTDRILMDRIKVAAAAAWDNSFASEVTIRSVSDSLEKAQIKLRKKNIPDYISIVPEFVAQITSYVKSSSRQNDLHAVLDIGAGTVDFAVFNVHEDDGDDKYPIYSKSVKPYGTFVLMRECLGAGEIEQRLMFEIENEFDYSQYYRPMNLHNKAMSQIKSGFNRAMTCYPQSPRWRSGLPLFLCGGGKNLDFYKELVTCVVDCREFIPGMSNKAITRSAFPTLDGLNAPTLSSKDHDRLSVAYGLSRDIDDFGILIKGDRLRKMQSYTQSQCSLSDRYIDKDQV